MNKRVREIEKEFKAISSMNQQTTYERDEIKNNFEEEEQENYSMVMTITKD